MYLMTNSADPDQLASSEANCSGSTLFTKTGHACSVREGLSQSLFPEFINFTTASDKCCVAAVKCLPVLH